LKVESLKFKDTEVYTAVAAVVYETRVGREVILLAMLEDQYAVIFQQRQGEVGYGLYIGQGIGRVGENDVELPLATFEETEHVAPDEGVVDGLHLADTLLNETCMVAIHLYAYYITASATEQFERYAACAGKEVEGVVAVEVYVACHHVEDVLLGEVSCGARLEGARHVEMASFILSGDYSHGLSC